MEVSIVEGAVYQIYRVTDRQGAPKKGADYTPHLNSDGYIVHLEQGYHFVFEHIKREGKPRNGILKTSFVQKMDRQSGGEGERLEITTENSVYYLKRAGG